MIVLAMLLAAAPSPAHAPSLATAYKREIALLEAERDALRAAKVDVDKESAARAAAERAKLAGLEATLVAERARTDGIAARISELERAGAVDDASLVPAVRSLKAALAKRGVHADGDLEAVLAAAAKDVERGSRTRAMDSGFFSADGDFVTGRILEVGHVARVGAAAHAAGPLASLGDAPPQVVEGADTADARAFVDGDGPLPLLLSSPARALAADEAPGLVARAGGPFGAGAGALALLSVLLGAAHLVLLVRDKKRANAVLARAVRLVEVGDTATAEVVCRAAGRAGAALAATVAAAARAADDDAVLDEAGDALLDEGARVDRRERVFVASALSALALAAAACFGPAPHPAGAALPFLLGVPAAALWVLTRGAGERLKVVLERGALRLVAAARAARTA